MLLKAGGIAYGYWVPFDFAEGGLSTALGWRLAPLRMTS